MDVFDLLTQIVPLQFIAFGAIYFTLIFYGTSKWKKYLGYEKGIFSAMSGAVIWIFFIVPISLFFKTLEIFQKEPLEIKYNDLFQYSLYNSFQYQYIFYVVLIYIVSWKLVSNKPLRDNKTFLNTTENLIIAIVSLLAIADYALLIAFSFSAYQEYLSHFIESSLLLILLFLFYLIFLKTVSTEEDLLAYIKNRCASLSQYFKNKKLTVFIILIFIFIPTSAALTGKFFLKTTAQIVEEKTNYLFITNTTVISPNYWQELRSLFYWDEIPGNDSEKLIEFLEERYGLEWVKNAEIEKIDENKEINISTGKNFISLRLNNEKSKINLKIDDGRTDEFIVKTEDNRLDVYVFDISGNYRVEQNISIKFGLIPWTKIKPNITFQDINGNFMNVQDYDFATGYLYEKDIPFNTKYVQLMGIKKGYVPQFYILEIKDLNDTIQRWDIKFNNTNSYPIDIFAIKLVTNGLKYINCSTRDMPLPDVAGDVIDHVNIPSDPSKIYSNWSITLYFEKI